ncbi:hypothetical protein AHiyo6_24440 [Arthrobacter sp. Hiyo6]|nr:hypothetical protein AHiyo6_24440 [Arthrobacter sp. Hiyo6]
MAPDITYSSLHRTPGRLSDLFEEMTIVGITPGALVAVFVALYIVLVVRRRK